MKNYFVLIFILLVSCSNDSNTTLEQENTGLPPFGALTKIEASYPTWDYAIDLRYYYNSSGKISSFVDTLIQPNTDDSVLTTNYEYNAEGKIFKSIISNSGEIKEYFYSQGLIVEYTSSYGDRHEIYTYNNLSQLITKEIYVGPDYLGAINYTYDENGNILTKNSNVSGNNIIYTFEYDTNNNPKFSIYDSQNIGKVMEESPNNIIKRTIVSEGTTTIFNIDYTYNYNGFPVSNREYEDGSILVGETTYTYNE